MQCNSKHIASILSLSSISKEKDVTINSKIKNLLQVEQTPRVQRVFKASRSGSCAYYPYKVNVVTKHLSCFFVQCAVIVKEDGKLKNDLIQTAENNKTIFSTKEVHKADLARRLSRYNSKKYF